MRAVKKYQKVLAGILAVVLLLSNTVTVFATGIKALTGEGTKPIVITKEYLEEKVNSSIEETSFTYNYKTPPKVVVTDGEKRVTEGEEKAEVYRLDKEIAQVVSKLTLPYQSDELKQNVLKQLEGKRFLSYYEGDATENSEKILFAIDKNKKTIVAIGSNWTQKEKTIVLAVEVEKNKTVDLLFSVTKEITIDYDNILNQVDIDSYKGTNTTVELTEIKEEIAKTQETSEDSLPEKEQETEKKQEKTVTYKGNLLTQKEVTQEQSEETKKTIELPVNGVITATATLDQLQKKNSETKQSETESDKEQNNLPDKLKDSLAHSGFLPTNDTPEEQEATLTGNKNAYDVEGAEDIFRVEVEIEGTPALQVATEPVPTDVIVVVDLSDSMVNIENGKTRWAWEKEALDVLADTLLEKGSDTQIAFVGFGNQHDFDIGAHYTFCNFTSDINQFKNTYKNLNDAGDLFWNLLGNNYAQDTNAHAGFVGARQEIEKRADNGREKFVIFVTDGMPNRYYTKDAKPYAESDRIKGVSTIDHPVYQKPITEAKRIKDQGATIFSVGIGEANDPSGGKEFIVDFFKGVSTEGHYTMGISSELKTYFQAIAESIKHTATEIEHQQVVLEDNMSTYVTYLPNYQGAETQVQYSSDGGASWNAYLGNGLHFKQEADGSFQWTIDDFDSNYKYRVVYYVQVKPEYHGQKIHKDQTDGANPEAGTDGVVLNGATTVKSDLVTEEQNIKVPAKYVDKQILQSPEFHTLKLATPIDTDQGTFHITVTFDGTEQIRKSGSETITDFHDNFDLFDPMSTYVNFLGEATDIKTQWRAKGSSDSFVDCNEGVAIYLEAQNYITWQMNRLDPTKEYRISYNVQVKEEYAGQKLFKTQTSGANPEEGNDGLPANEYTYCRSSLITNHEILVPAVWRSLVLAEGDIESLKQANVVKKTDPGYEWGLYEITLLLHGKPREISDQQEPGGVRYVTHKDVILTDPMSEFVTYQEGSVKVQRALMYSENWEELDPSSVEINFENNTLTAQFKELENDMQYRMVYFVKVKSEYEGVRLHMDQSSGKNPDLPQEGEAADGLIANGYTRVNSSLLPVEKEIMVPTVTLDKEEPNSVSFAFTKVKADNTAQVLSGAHFKLYYCEETHDHEELVTDQVLESGSCWKEYDEKITYISDEYGKVDIGNLVTGTYMLLETKAPVGYETPIGGQWRIAIDAETTEENKQIIITGVGAPKPPAFKRDGNGNYLLPNLPQFQLPMSGMTGVYPYLAIGGGVMLVATATLIKKRKKDRSET